METKIEEERAMMESLGDCPECGHDLPGVAKLIGGRWQLFCTECRICVIGSRDYAVKCWGLKAAPHGAKDEQALRARICRALDIKGNLSDDQIVTAAELHHYEFLRLFVADAARATAEQSEPKGWITQDGATFTLEAAAERGKTPQALAYAAVSRALGGIEKICRNHGYNYAEVLHDWLEAKLSAAPADHSAWFAVTSGAAASLEDAAVCMQDPDAKRSAEGAATFTRKRIKELLSALSNGS